MPTRGQGKCPAKKNKLRYGKKQCNRQGCLGDEECIDVADVVIAVDGSGSLRKEGFETLKQFTRKLVKRLRTRKYKKDRLKVGVVQFGNGEILTSGKGKNKVKTIRK